MTRRNRDLPPRCYQKHGAFFFVDRSGKWHNLGRDRIEAMVRYDEMNPRTPAQAGSVARLIDDAMPTIGVSVKANTLRQYKQCAERLKVIFAEFKATEVTPRHVAQVKMSLSKKPNMANRMLTVIRLVFAYAVECQLVEWNPAVSIKRFRENKRDRLLSHDEIEAIREQSPARLRCMIDILRITGQRIGDVISLRRSSLTEDGVMFVQQKTGAKLVVAWTDELRDAVNEALALHQNVKAMTLFHTRKGGAPSYYTVRDQWKRVVTKVGVPDARLHDLRARAITDARKQGRDAQGLAGHTDFRMTERYVRERETPIVTPPSVKLKTSGK